jgi:hypothetical protein
VERVDADAAVGRAVVHVDVAVLPADAEQRVDRMPQEAADLGPIL